MIMYEMALSINFGEVGHRGNQQPFRVRLDAAPLVELIRATDDAHRIYELLLIDRPGDVWDYVWVLLDEIPKAVARRVAHARQTARPDGEGSSRPWPEDRVPFNTFDGLFYWATYDTDPEDEAWLLNRDADPMRSFVKHLLSVVRAAQRRLEWNDHLLRHVVSRVRSAEHPYCFLDRGVALSESRELPPNAAQHTPAFYRKLDGLLRDPDLASVAYRANGDYRVLRMMATEQRRRATLTGHEPGHAMHLSALVNNRISNEAWESEIWLFDEGLAHGDLFIEGGGLGGGNLKVLLDSRHRAPSKFILSTRDEGSIAGFTVESGDGWVLYSKENSDSRRMALQRIEDRRKNPVGAVLSFSDNGATIFGHEKSVVLVGAEVSSEAREVLAAVIADWQRCGGEPLVVVIGDAARFDLAGCNDVVSVPADSVDEAALARWLRSELLRARPWLDVLIALRAPGWARRALAEQAQHATRPWPCYVVVTEGQSGLDAAHVLEGDLTRVLREAHERAASKRPRLL
jgi:hypothetical protein